MLKAEKLHKTYQAGGKKIEVLKGVDLEVGRGEFAVVVGPSGAGKSTLLHILGGLDRPDSGKVFFEGRDIYASGEAQLCRLRNKGIGFVFQFYHLLPEFTALENVLLPRLISSQFTVHSSQNNNAAAKGLLREVGLEGRAGHFPGELSGGEQQRVAIARALSNEPSLLLCDEPTGNLDSLTGREIASLLEQACLRQGMAMLMVTHNLELAKSAQRVYHLRDGILHKSQ